MDKHPTSFIRILKNSVRSTLFNYLSNYKDVVWLIGSGRSGTTWISNLINHDKSFRELFEPFHPKNIKYSESPMLHQYVPSTENDPGLLRFAKEVFSGKFTNNQVDKGNTTKLYTRLLVKDISVNLFAHSISKNFPNLKTILLIRNPFAVALSKIKTKDWGWMNDPGDFLHQEKLVKDHLQPFVTLIERVSKDGEPLEKQILIWCIINYIPLHQFAPEHLHIIFYENFLLNPQEELNKLNAFINVNRPANVSQELIKSPSKVTTDKKNLFEIDSWKKSVTEEQLIKSNFILKAFGFDQMYLPDSRPNPTFKGIH